MKDYVEVSKLRVFYFILQISSASIGGCWESGKICYKPFFPIPPLLNFRFWILDFRLIQHISSL